MGCGSSRIFDVDEAIPGQGRKALETFRSLGLRDSDIDKLYRVFQSFDVKSDNGIEISEFLLKLHLGLRTYSNTIYFDCIHRIESILFLYT
jgi:Ca2+-binding EF-hand superfamily protein